MSATTATRIEIERLIPDTRAKKLTDPTITEQELNHLYKQGKVTAKVIEYNCRFGDPEVQGVIGGVKNLNELIVATCEGRLDEVEVIDDNKYRVLVTLISDGYPGDYDRDKEITIGSLPEGVEIIHAGTKIGKDGKLYTNGGRVMGVLAEADTLEQAITLAYEGVEQVSFEGMKYRVDIGRQYNPLVNWVEISA
jgi:phosphoribosylamine-glycine ligase